MLYYICLKNIQTSTQSIFICSAMDWLWERFQFESTSAAMGILTHSSWRTAGIYFWIPFISTHWNVLQCENKSMPTVCNKMDESHKNNFGWKKARHKRVQTEWVHSYQVETQTKRVVRNRDVGVRQTPLGSDWATSTWRPEEEVGWSHNSDSVCCEN